MPSLKTEDVIPPIEKSGIDYIEEFDLGLENKQNSRPYFGKEADVVLFKEAKSEIIRFMKIDKLVSSFKNVVTVSCMEVMLKWMLCDLIPHDFLMFLKLSRLYF